jgi:nucleoside-diphosphate-sugar epimerase
MKTLVTGAGGFLGRYVVDELIRRGHTVRALIRPNSAHRWSCAVETFCANLQSHGDLKSAFNEIDAVVHLAVATTGDKGTKIDASQIATERFLEAMVKTEVGRLLHVSSLVVYDWTNAKAVLNEDTPLRCDVSEMDTYTVAKVSQERTVARFANDYLINLTIARPGFVWGPQRTEIAGMGRHWPPFYVMFGPFGRLPLTHVANCASCLVTMLESPAAVGQVFNIVDGDNIRVWRYVWEYARRNGGPGVPIPIPYRLGLGAAQLARMINQKLFRTKGKLPSLLNPDRFESQFKPLLFSNQKLQDVLNWRAPLSFEECLAQTYELPKC